MTEGSDELDRTLEHAGFEILTEDEDEFRDGEWLVMSGGRHPNEHPGRPRAGPDERG